MEPKVTLVSWTKEPLKVVHVMTQNMMGNTITDLDTVTEEEALETLQQMKKTSITGALEFVVFIFQVENVSRALTHQIVRTRIGTYSQESMRFSVQDKNFGFDTGGSISGNPAAEAEYNNTMAAIGDSYHKLLEMGASAEDARGLLPTNITTKIGIKWDLKTLIGVSEVRLCMQSQAHWQSILTQMQKEIADKVHPEIAGMLGSYCDHHGKCGFLSLYDRVCPKQALFEE